MKVYGYNLSLTVVEYQTAILRNDHAAAKEILPGIPKDQLNRVARFLEHRGTWFFFVFWRFSNLIYHLDLKELAIQVTTDPDHKFDLALSLDDLDLAHSIVQSLSTASAPSSSQQQQQQQDLTLSEPKWKLLGDSALKVWRFDLAKECFTKAGDLGSLLLLVLSVGDRDGLVGLVDKASASFFSLSPSGYSFVLSDS